MPLLEELEAVKLARRRPSCRSTLSDLRELQGRALYVAQAPLLALRELGQWILVTRESLIKRLW